jgi:O-antigen/teichoic acid export membrane protein
VVFNFLTTTLNGLKLVHITGVLSTVKIGVRSLLQISALIIGLGLVGLFLGYVVGFLIVIVVGTIILYKNIGFSTLPTKGHFRRTFSFAKFAWIGNVSRKVFNWIDVLVLGFFVPSGLIGIYSAAWNIGQFLSIFGSSLSITLFPEISEVSANEDPQVAADLFESSLAFAGVFSIPGLVGGGLLANRILRVYGDEFTKGGVILIILIISLLFQGYRKQFLTVFNAVDRPDIAFRVNGFLILLNIVLNVVLVYAYGWIGAAVATTISVAGSLLYAYVKARQLLEFSVPVREISREWLAALVMGAVVFSGRWIENSYSVLGYNFLVLLILVGLGAGVYFSTLLVISPRFRLTVFDNLPLKWLPIDLSDWE